MLPNTFQSFVQFKTDANLYVMRNNLYGENLVKKEKEFVFNEEAKVDNFMKYQV